MQIMLPPHQDALGSLAEVMKSCYLALTGRINALGLSRSRAMIVVLIDGLGDENLRHYSGHARALWKDRIGRLTSVLPTTTAAALSSLMTGELPGQHGIVGYKVRHPETGVVLNQLSDWGNTMKPESWQLLPTLMETSPVKTIVFSEPKHQHSGLTHAILRGTEYRGVASLSDRFIQARQAVIQALAQSKTEPLLCYVYVSDLDQISHKRGVGTDGWVNQLEQIDQLYQKLKNSLPDDVGVLVTADHGALNVPQEDHIVLSAESVLFEDVSAVAGEPRCMQLYCGEPGEEPSVQRVESVVQRWKREFRTQAWVLTKAELIASGTFGDVHHEAARRLGDIFIFARDQYAFYHSDDLGGRKMVGQHGSISPEEFFVPLILAGV